MSAATLSRQTESPASLFADTGLTVQRTDILFTDVAPGRVAIEITVTNLGHEPTAPTYAVIGAAPLGAFVPWQPLTAVPMPALAPGESVVLHTEAARPRPRPLGPPDRVTPRQLLTAIEPEDEQPGQETRLGRIRRAQLTVPALPADLTDLLTRGGMHWAGNLNVFVGGKAVERHMAQALRIYPGVLNTAMFVVGNGRPDAYRFHLDTTADVETTLYDMTTGGSLRIDLGREPVREGNWIEARGQCVMMLALRPPKDCGECKVAVHVTQRSSGSEAVVEFSLDPKAAGPGCYTL